MTYENNEFIISTPQGNRMVKKKSTEWTGEYIYIDEYGAVYKRVAYEGTGTFQSNITPLNNR